MAAEKGPKGEKGEKGEKGDPGERGPQGEPGKDAPTTPPPPARVPRSEQLDAWFKYHPPTPETAPKFAAIGKAYSDSVDVFVWALEQTVREPQVFNEVSRVLRTFVETIDTVCPSCADASAAVRCVRLARNGMNDILMRKDTSLSFVYDQLLAAKFQANSAIACAGV